MAGTLLLMMMRRLFALCFLLFCMLSLSACSSMEPSPYETVNDNPDLRLSFSHILWYQPDQAYFTLENNGTDPYSFGDYYTIEKKVGGRWVVVPYSKNGSAWVDISHVVMPGRSREIVISLSAHHDPLSPGTYRMVNEFRNDETKEVSVLAAEFIVGKKS
ncbi:MAG: hypothetical protein E7458_01035 [Ruminococcaceae bacterium]|nr:hypothetical protein [Oscillospiraceae bacterium]